MHTAEDLESLENLHALCSLMQTICTSLVTLTVVSMFVLTFELICSDVKRPYNVRTHPGRRYIFWSRRHVRMWVFFAHSFHLLIADTSAQMIPTFQDTKPTTVISYTTPPNSTSPSPCATSLSNAKSTTLTAFNFSKTSSSPALWMTPPSMSSTHVSSSTRSTSSRISNRIRHSCGTSCGCS